MKRFIQIIIFLLLAFFCLIRTYDVLCWKDTNVSFQSCVLQLDETPDNTVDVAFVGSSHVYTGIYPAYLWSDYGISAFDMAICAMDRDSAYYSIKHLFKTQSPKVVFVDLYALTYETHEYPDNILRNYLSFPISKDTYPALKTYAAKDPTVSENMLDYLTRWPIFHTRYRELERRDFVNDEYALAARGEYLNWAANAVTPLEPDPFEPELGNEDQLEWMKKLKAICEENGAQLVLMALPFQTDYDDQHLVDYASVFAEENGIPFFDFNRKIDEVGLDYSTDFYDDSHMNAYGAKKTCAYFGTYLKENYTLEDHRGDPRYAIWEEDLRYYRHRMDGDELDTIQDLDGFLNKLMQMSEVVTVISLEGVYDSAALYDSLKVLPGMTQEDCEAGSKWLWENGQLTLLMHNDLGAPAYIRELDDYTTLQVRFNGDRIGGGNLILGRNDYSNYEGQLRIVVYDPVMHKTIAAREYTYW